MTRLYHPSISSSPVALAFPFIEWIPPTIAISRPEHSLLRSAEEGPLEYIISDHQESYAYARLLLKVLDQVTGPSNPGRVAELTLEQSALDQEDALQYLQDDKTGVVTHYLITKLYDFIGLLTQQQPDSFVQILTIFYREDKLLEDWRPLLRLLYRQGDPFSQRGAALSLMYILKEGCRKESSTRITTAEETLQSLVSWLTSRLQSSHSMSLAVVTPVLVVLGTCPPARAFFDHAGGIGYLSRHLRPMRGGGAGGPSTMGRRTTSTTMMPSSPASTTRISSFNSFNSTLAISSTFSMTAPSSPNGKRRPISLGTNSSAQQLYELVFCLWTMTYDCSQNSTMKHHFARDGAVAALAEMMSSAPREKVVRLALSSLRRLVETDAKLFLPEMIACRVLKSVDLLIQQKQWSDPDMAEDMQVLQKILTSSYQDLTTWEVYLAELDSGMLKAGIIHTEQFFKTNARQMEGKNGDFCHVKRLIHLISRREDDETVAMALFDLGEFVRFYPNGKSIANRLGAKRVVMPLLRDNEEYDIQRHTLLCISKLLVNNWKAVVPS